MTRADNWRPEIRRRAAQVLTGLGAAAVLAASTIFARAIIAPRRVRDGLARPVISPQPVVAWPDVSEPGAWATRVFYAAAGRADAPGAGDVGRFRLAGTFVVLGDPEEGATGNRKAIIDDREGARQYLLSEGDAVGGMRVVRILPDRVRVVLNGRDMDLHLAYKDPVVGSSPRPMPDREAPDGLEEDAHTSRFGRRLADDRWVLDRAALMGYYHDMLDHPERIIDLYGSFAAVRDEAGGIDGYRVGVGDERDFFDAVGLQAGDRIVAANSLRMRSQARAEYFLREFVRDDLDTIVLDVERDGEMRQQVYIMR